MNALILLLSLGHNLYTTGACPNGYVVKSVPRTSKPVCVAASAAGPHTHPGGDITSAVGSSTALAADPAACGASQWVRDLAANGTLTCSTPAFTDISGVLELADLPAHNHVWSDVTGAPSVPPADALYWTGAAHAGLSAEKDLSGWTGIVKNTAGTPSAAVAGDLPGGPYASAGACAAGSYVHTVNAGAGPTCSAPPGTLDGHSHSGATLPAATTLATGLVQLTNDLAGTAAAPEVVNDSHTHTSISISSLDATNDFTVGVLPGARGGVGVALPTCSGTDKLTANGTSVSCAADAVGGGVSRTFLANTVSQNTFGNFTTIFSVTLAQVTGKPEVVRFVLLQSSTATAAGVRNRARVSGNNGAGHCSFATFTAAAAAEFDTIALTTTAADTVATSTATANVYAVNTIDCVWVPGNTNATTLTVDFTTETTGQTVSTAYNSFYEHVTN